MTYKIIRDILEYHLTQVTDVPDIFWEGVDRSPQSGVPYVRPKFQPTSTRPSVRGSNPQKRYQGLYRVFVYYPEGRGPQDVETCVGNILETFDATKDLSFGGNTLRVEYSERGQVLTDSPWVYVPIDIAWYYYD
jgi:hypothetical protein